MCITKEPKLHRILKSLGTATDFAKQANLFNGGPKHKTYIQKGKKSKNLFPFIAQEIRTKTFIDEQPLTLF